jgi:FkbM family methyltransferase
MRSLLERGRAAAVRLVDRLGWREPIRALNERWSPSRRVRRDGRDRRHLDVLIASTVGPNDLCVDVGANVGSVTQTMIRVAPSVRHVLVEPLPDLAARLGDQFPTCEVHATALADHEGSTEFTRNLDRPTRSGIDPGQTKAGQRTEKITVPITTLDTLLAGRSPRFVKIDVEGAELDVLRGASHTLETARPLVVFEHQPDIASEFDATRAIHKLLGAAQYRVFDIDGTGPYDPEAFVAVCKRGHIWNFVAVPETR